MKMYETVFRVCANVITNCFKQQHKRMNSPRNNKFKAENPLKLFISDDFKQSKEDSNSLKRVVDRLFCNKMIKAETWALTYTALEPEMPFEPHCGVMPCDPELRKLLNYEFTEVVLPEFLKEKEIASKPIPAMPFEAQNEYKYVVVLENREAREQVAFLQSISLVLFLFVLVALTITAGIMQKYQRIVDHRDTEIYIHQLMNQHMADDLSEALYNISMMKQSTLKPGFCPKNEAITIVEPWYMFLFNLVPMD
jgi:hypothetical protein